MVKHLTLNPLIISSFSSSFILFREHGGMEADDTEHIPNVIFFQLKSYLRKKTK